MLKLGLETESLHLLFQNKRIDIFEFIEIAHKLGLDGVQINVIKDYNLDEKWGALGSNDPSFLKKVKDLLNKYGMYVEIDMRSLEYHRVEEVLKVASFLGADIVRSYIPIKPLEKNLNIKLGSEGAYDFAKIRYDFDPKSFDTGIEMIKKIIPLLKKYRIKLALENHEYETSTELVETVKKINSPWVGLLFDFGNSMMAWEDPVVACKNMAPYTLSTHFKDHIVIKDSKEKDEFFVCGVPIGKGNLPLEECFKILMDKSTIQRINIESCYPYCAQFKRSIGTGGVSKLGLGAFKIEKAPYDTNTIHPLQYYYPHEVSKELLEKMIIDQFENLKKSVEFLKKLRESILE